MFDNLIYSIIVEYNLLELLYVCKTSRGHAIAALRRYKNISSDDGRVRHVTEDNNSDGFAMAGERLVDYFTGKMYHYRIGIDNDYFIMRRCNERLKLYEETRRKKRWPKETFDDIETLVQIFGDEYYCIYRVYYLGNYATVYYKYGVDFSVTTSRMIAVNNVYYDNIGRLVFDTKKKGIYKLSSNVSRGIMLYDDITTIGKYSTEQPVYYFYGHRNGIISAKANNIRIYMKHVQTVDDFLKKCQN